MLYFSRNSKAVYMGVLKFPSVLTLCKCFLDCSLDASAGLFMCTANPLGQEYDPNHDATETVIVNGQVCVPETGGVVFSAR